MTTARQGWGQIAYIQGQVFKKCCLPLAIFPFSSLSLQLYENNLARLRDRWGASQVAQMVKCLPAMQETQVRSLGWEDPLEKEMATCSSILAWRIPWMEEPGRLQSMGWQRVGYD